jgi:putative Holliday junction resolvase
MAVLALDYGTKRIGVAVSDATLTLARPLSFLNAEPFQQLVAALRTLVKEHELSLILVGMPRNMDGTYGPSAERVKVFVFHLKQTLTVPIETRDERLTTVQASRQLREAGHKAREQKTIIDSASAVVLLQSYLDQLAMQSEEPRE